MATQDTVNLFWSRALVGKSIQTNPANPPSCEVVDGTFIQRIYGHPSNLEEILEASQIPDHALKQIRPGVTNYTWYTHADQLFGENGVFARAKKDYQVREPQLQLARMIQRAVEMGVTGVGEAGTGTGKSFAYLGTLVSMGKRIIVSAPTNALISQLLTKDLPFLQTVFPEMTFTGIMGKGNYFCPAKIYRESEYLQNCELAPKIDNVQFTAWFESPGCSGTIGDYPYLADDVVKSLLCDEDSICRDCPFRDLCPYQSARQEAVDADVVVTNHAMLCIAETHKGAQLLPVPDVLVIDEAHELTSYARNTCGVSLSKKSIERVMKRIEDTIKDIMKKSHTVSLNMEKLDDMATLFMNEVWATYGNSGEQYQALIDADTEFEGGKAFAKALDQVALLIWDFKQRPASKDETKWMNFATSLLRKSKEIQEFCGKTKAGYVRYVDIKEDTYFITPFDVSNFLGGMIEPVIEPEVSEIPRTCCQGCEKELASIGDSCFVLNGLGYCPSCINDYDVFYDSVIVTVAEFISQPEPEPYKPYSTILVSATLAVGKKAIQVGSLEIEAPDFDSLRSELGIKQAIELCVESPFDYKNQLILYIPKKFPSPKDSNEHQERLIADALNLVRASMGGAFLLFTSNKALKVAYDQLGEIFKKDGFLVLRQGELSKTEIINQFKNHGRAVLFATRSFWTGVDLPGAIRLEMIDKLPFEAPGPISEAQSAYIKNQAIESGISPDIAKWLPFKQVAIPNMIRTLKQGVGRVIRDTKSAGVCAIMDPRIWSETYGKSILDSLPDATVTSNLAYVERYFRVRKDEIMINTTQSVTEFEPLPF